VTPEQIRKQIGKLYREVAAFLHFSPLSLAKKCGVTFGAAVILVLVLALSIPYIWMRQLTRNELLGAGRAKSEMLLRRHFQTEGVGEGALPRLDNTGAEMDPNSCDILWIRLGEENTRMPSVLRPEQEEMIKDLTKQDDREDDVELLKYDGVRYSSYVRIIRAMDNCLSCHNPQGPAAAFGKNQLVGAIVVQRLATDIGKTMFMTGFWIIVAGFIAGTGAIVTFYIITQRVILRPIRQLRALANNVAEGNLDIRSSIKTRDEYEKLANAFNHMLDELQKSQEKLRQTNKQLDAKIAELSERNIELFKANKVKSEFLANISHEFRTPLNAILGFAEILRDKPALLKKEKGRRYAENIITSGRNLLNLINDLLDLAKTEAGKIELHVARTDLAGLCKGVVASFSEMTRQKKIKVRLDVEEDIPELMTDPGKVQQILYNFVSNAVKFTPTRGRIEIRASMLDDRHVRIAVTDTGCGIAPADREKIFEKFRQADGSLTRESTGTGLGLAISKELATMLAGNIGLESEPGKGSTFWLDIPVTITKEQQPKQSPA